MNKHFEVSMYIYDARNDRGIVILSVDTRLNNAMCHVSYFAYDKTGDVFCKGCHTELFKFTELEQMIERED